MALYGRFQTEKYRPPAVVNGKVPRNACAAATRRVQARAQ